MSSNIFNSIGIGWMDPAIFIISIVILLFILFIITIVQAFMLGNLKKKYKKFMSDSDGESLENQILKHIEDIRYLKKNSKKADLEILNIKKNLTFAYQKIAIVKYDAFREMGGKLSFSVCMLDDNDDGFILNSVHSMEACYTYVKEVRNGRADVVLGEEENEALNKALKSNYFEPVLINEESDITVNHENSSRKIVKKEKRKEEKKQEKKEEKIMDEESYDEYQEDFTFEEIE